MWCNEDVSAAIFALHFRLTASRPWHHTFSLALINHGLATKQLKKHTYNRIGYLTRVGRKSGHCQIKLNIDDISILTLRSYTPGRKNTNSHLNKHAAEFVPYSAGDQLNIHAAEFVPNSANDHLDIHAAEFDNASRLVLPPVVPSLPAFTTYEYGVDGDLQ